MHFEYSRRTQEMLERVRAFMDEHIYPNEARYEEEAHQGERWKVIPVIEELKPKARAAGLWNMIVPPNRTAKEYADSIRKDAVIWQGLAKAANLKEK